MNARRARFMRPAGLAWLCLCLCAGAARSQPTPLERQVKAAYLYKFATFVEWPDGSFTRPDAPLYIGVAGNEALAEQAEQMTSGRMVGSHPLAIRKIRRGDSLSGIHILFVGSADTAAMAELLAAARSRSLLTVSDAEDGATLGSMVNFVVADERLRFEVMLKNVAPSRLRISARMLAAAFRVRGAP